MMMRCVLVLCVALPLGCKGSGDSSGTTGAAEQGSSPGARGQGEAPGGRLVRAGEDSAAGRALAALVAIELPDLTESPGCAEYGEKMGAFSASLERELKALRSGDGGVRAGELARLGSWLEDRVKVLEQVAPSRAVSMDELNRLHQELTAALFDLGDSLSAAFGPSGRRGDESAAARVENAARNIAATIAALQTLCARS